MRPWFKFLRRTQSFLQAKRTTRLRIEELESRTLLSSTLGTFVAKPAIDLLVSGSGSQESLTSPPATALTPAQIRQAYQENVSFNGVAGQGQGQTIAIVDAYSDPNIASDLNTFSKEYGLPTVGEVNPSTGKAYFNFTQLNENGGTSLPQASTSWSQEISLDVEWAHAIAPQANIVLVDASSSSLNDLLSAVNTARNYPGVSVVSMSWGGSEFPQESQYDSYFTTPAGHTPITFVASAGDDSAYWWLAPGLWPSVSPNVLSVGGTSLHVNSSGTYEGESAWAGSGGGFSYGETEPSYQYTVQDTGMRTAPDVAYDANPNTGVAVYDSYVGQYGQGGWMQIGGTSTGAPQWAALIAVADQGRAMAGESTLNGASNTLPALYQLYATSSYTQDFHDVTGGGNGYYAQAGYNLVTGLGSPDAYNLMNYLVNQVATSGKTVAVGNTSAATTTTQQVTAPTPTEPRGFHGSRNDVTATPTAPTTTTVPPGSLASYVESIAAMNLSSPLLTSVASAPAAAPVIANYAPQTLHSSSGNATAYNFPVYPNLVDPTQSVPGAVPATNAPSRTPAPVVPTDQGDDDDGSEAPAAAVEVRSEGCDSYFASGHWRSLLRGSAPIVVTGETAAVWNSMATLAGCAIVFGAYGGFIRPEDLEDMSRRQPLPR